MIWVTAVVAVLLVMVLPGLAFAGSADAVPGGSTIDDLVRHYTAAAIAAAATTVAGLAAQLWRKFKTATKISENALGMSLARQAAQYAEQLFQSGQILADQRKPRALAYWRKLATGKKLPTWIIDMGDEMIETAVAEINEIGVKKMKAELDKLGKDADAMLARWNDPAFQAKLARLP